MARIPPIQILAVLLGLPSLILAQTSSSPSPPPQPQPSQPPSRATASTTSTQTQSPTASPLQNIPCNNSPLLCTRAYDNVTHMGAHDSSFLRDASTSNSLAGNQYFNATVALSAGIRLLSAQVHSSSSSGTLQLCHSYCELLDAGPLADWLSAIRYWLDGNPNEVVTLLLVNSDNQPASAFGSAFDSAGISHYGYVPPSSSSSSSSNNSSSSSNTTTTTWPTLESMISSNKRLVTFIASVPDPPSPDHPFLLPEFRYVFETSYNITSASHFGCDLDRPSSAGSASEALGKGMMGLVNHFRYIDLGSGGIQIPDVGNIEITNSPSLVNGSGNLGEHLTRCQGGWGGRKPVFALVDFFDKGPSVEAAGLMSGLKGDDIVGRTAPTAKSTSGAVKEGGSGVVAALVGFLGIALVLL
ncbi:PLC-like phosphodiesterase [Cladorrhinum samala]|uniref:PLC-like phosphodiesterase n=1 Tax=Cladorrhinum samala TaxID=585594 RepID=A0AAV9HH20_9PEZI|nr:PLC-like phosphodiesterase [Cladorrhinum samala]